VITLVVCNCFKLSESGASLDWKYRPGVATMYDLVLHSSHEASITSSCKGKILRLEQDVPVCVIGGKSFVVLLNRMHVVLLLDEALSVSGVKATAQL
jgi:hypothetical protein